jgi:hypothetical protein
MPQLPDISYGQVGTATPQADRQMSSADLSGPGRAIAGLGNAAGSAVMDYQQQQDKVGTAYATSHLLTSAIEAQKAAELEPDPAKAQALYDQSKARAIQEASAMIPGGAARQMFIADSAEHTRYTDMAFGQNLVNKKENLAIGSAHQAAQNNMTQALAAPDEASAAALIQNTNDLYHTLTLTAPTKFTPLDEQNARNQWVNTYVKTKISGLLDSGDIDSANRIYATNKEMLPGTDRMEVEKMLHSSNMQQFGDQGVAALKSGQAPAPIGGNAVQDVKDTVASAAQAAGLDPSASLTIASIESGFGQSVGKRGDIGQTGKPAANIQEQAQNLVDAQKEAKAATDKALGGASEPWQQYVTYQQGVGGGPALLTADPSEKAVDVLAPFYKNSAIAQKAITGNGGNASMTVGQFLAFINRNYDAHAARVAVGLPDSNEKGGPTVQADNAVANPAGIVATNDNSAPADAQADTGASFTPVPGSLPSTNPQPSSNIPALQPAATPVQALVEYDKVYPQYLQYANSLPNIVQRDALLKSLEHDHAVYQASATAWKTQFQNQAQNLAMDPKFTSVSQIPADMRAALADNPVTMNYLESRAKYNLDNGAGAATKDQREYGKGFYDLFKGIHSTGADKITSVEQLQSHVGEQGDLTIAGYDKLANELVSKKTPEGASEGIMSAASLKTLKTQLSGEDIYPGMKDPKGEEIYASALPAYFKAIEDGKAKGIPIGELLNPSSKNWAGQSVQAMRRPSAQWNSDLAIANLSLDSGDTSKKPDVTKGAEKEDPTVRGGLEKSLQDGKIELAPIQDAFKNGKISKQTALNLIVAGGFGKSKAAQPIVSAPRP